MSSALLTSDVIAVLEEKKYRIDCRSSLLSFSKHIKPTYIWSWHHLVVIEALERVASGQLSRLIVTIPPRHTKSTLVSEVFPTWYLGKNPHNAVILASYNHDLASSFGKICRDTVESPEYRRIFDSVTVSSDSRAADKWKIAGSPQRVSMLSAGVGGSAAGYGANVLVIDDYLKNAEDAGSETIRQKQHDWYSTTARTRLQPNGAIILVATRWHDDDLIGRILQDDKDTGEWEVIHLKAIATEDEEYRMEGQALWREYYNEASLLQTRREIGEQAFSALYQGLPVPVGGHLLKSEWLKEAPLPMYAEAVLSNGIPPSTMYPPINSESLPDDSLPHESHDDSGTESSANADDELEVVGSSYYDWLEIWGVDPSTGEGADNTAIAKLMWSPSRGIAILFDILYGKWSFSEMTNKLIGEHLRRPARKIVIEKVAFSAWATQHLKTTTYLPVVASKTPLRKKATRLAGMGAMGTQFETGRVLIPPIKYRTHGILVFMQEWANFPAGKNDDTLDATNLAIEGTGLTMGITIPKAHRPFGAKKVVADNSIPWELQS